MRHLKLQRDSNVAVDLGRMSAPTPNSTRSFDTKPRRMLHAMAAMAGHTPGSPSFRDGA